MKLHPMIVVALAWAASLWLAPSADAQLLWRWFGPKTPDNAAEKPAARPAPADERRAMEVNVEIAWLADMVTFPYYLEAHTTASKLEVRGYVPNKTVREQAMRIAQVYSSLPVIDSMKEHASLLVRPGQMSPQQLQASAQSSLKVALPKAYPHLKVQVSPDGKVYVAGTVNTNDERIAVSHSLRRLHGCTSVQNQTALPGELARTPATAPPPEPRERLPIVKTSNPNPKAEKPVVAAETKSRPWYWPFGKSQPTTKDEPPLLDPKPSLGEGKKPNPPTGPILIPSGPERKELVKAPPPKNEVVKVELPAPPVQGPRLTAAELQKHIKAAWPSAKSVQVEFTSASEVRVVLEIRTDKDVDPAAERVFALPELQSYRADLQFKISAP